MRHPAISILAVLIVVALLGGGAVWLGTRTHHGTGSPDTPPPPRAPIPVHLCQSCAYGFNPLGNPTDEHPDASLAIDNQPGTYWNTQTYYDDKLDKAGVGLYVDANPGTTARILRVTTATPGFTATVYARDTKPPLRWPDPGWAQISSPTNIAAKRDIKLTSGTTPVPLLPAVDHQPRRPQQPGDRRDHALQVEGVSRRAPRAGGVAWAGSCLSRPLLDSLGSSLRVAHRARAGCGSCLQPEHWRDRHRRPPSPSPATSR